MRLNKYQMNGLSSGIPYMLNMNRKFGRSFNYKRIYRYVVENVLNQKFIADKPNEKWVTDVTKFKYGSSNIAYLSTILDLYDGSIVSYVLGYSNNKKLVFKTIDQSIALSPCDHPTYP
ncbi:DDE-type integrase/transposase/recombinase [Oceanobacillus halophilus]|uniref:Integrase catalytic domain-containing protein n=1 Tax=Oceanobacillus halophilus TaxID=930130 RepID=A0A495A3Q9_9BACI|nr:DDE-type integrase/transposase/recombinase [Oceanobacillus halophilus]RKQ34255.1 hypothetical protein D8M06_07685 [Oceanobacillus halophilus]